jgi:hypothetical protein
MGDIKISHQTAFQFESLKKRNCSLCLGARGQIIWNSNSVCDKFNWLRIESSDGFCEHCIVLSVSTESLKFLAKLSNCQPFKDPSFGVNS